MRPMLDVCSALFRRTQQHPIGGLDAAGVSELLRPFALSLAASSAEVSFLLQHPLWLPTPLSPLLVATRMHASHTFGTDASTYTRALCCLS